MTVDIAQSTPDWLLQREAALCPCGCIGKRKRTGYLEKTLAGGSSLLRQVMFADDTARQAGLLQRIDPRAKLVGLVLLLVGASLLHTIPVLLALYALTLLLAATSGLPVWFFVKRVWLFVPIFTGIVVLPATLSIVTGGDVVLTLWHWHGQPQGFTAQGLTTAGLVISRVAVSISLVVLLTLTTPWVRLLAALRSLGVPRLFVLVIGMAYRYLFLLLGTVTDMYEARRSRAVGRQQHDRSARAFVAAGAGALFGKAHQLSEEVHQAMIARGYRGDARTLEPPRLRAADAVWVAAAAAVAVLAWYGDHLVR
jgi:cobalt/nickel transport system permease protein